MLGLRNTTTIAYCSLGTVGCGMCLDGQGAATITIAYLADV